MNDKNDIFVIGPPEEPAAEPCSIWKGGTPELVLILVHSGQCLLLDHCGRKNEHESCYGNLQEQVESTVGHLGDGLWVVTGEPDYSRDYLGEVDGSWDYSATRRLTDLEWDHFREGSGLYLDAEIWPKEWKEATVP